MHNQTLHNIIHYIVPYEYNTHVIHVKHEKEIIKMEK